MKSRVLHTGDAETRLFAVPFPYLSTTHVRVYVNKFPLNYPYDYQWTGDGSIELRHAPKTKDAIEIARVTTDTEALVQFQNGAVLTEQELNTAMLQMLYLLQETRDMFDASFGAGINRIAGTTGILGATAEDVINNVIAEVLNDELTAHLQQRISDISLNAEDIIAQRIRLQDVEELVNALDGIEGDVGTLILNEKNERIEGDGALASTMALIGAKSGDALSFILDLAKVKVSPTEALGTRLTAIQASLGANTAAVAAETTARTTADAAIAQTVTNVNARVGVAEGLITTEQTARATADAALTTRVDGMLATVNDNKALILAEQTARANGDSAEASARQTLQTQVNGNQASIETQQTVINGLAAQYSVKLDVNGHVAGFGLWNSGGSARFTILADKFAIVTPGQNPVVPFAVDGSGVYMDTAYVRNLVVDKITGGNINSQWNLNNSGGRIVLDTGSFMKVLGVGFGANADLIEWFGPKMAINACTKANAVTYVGTNGSAYFGGSLSAGTLYNAARTTSIGVPVSAVVGPFTTNGNAKTVVVSYDYVHSNPNNASSIGNGPGGIATIKLYRTIGSGSEVLLATYQVQFTRFSEPDINWMVSESGGGSWTYTDTSAGTLDRTYRVEVASRTGTATNINTQPSQSAGAIITEQ